MGDNPFEPGLCDPEQHLSSLAPLAAFCRGGTGPVRFHSTSHGLISVSAPVGGVIGLDGEHELLHVVTVAREVRRPETPALGVAFDRDGPALQKVVEVVPIHAGFLEQLLLDLVAVHPVELARRKVELPAK